MNLHDLSEESLSSPEKNRIAIPNCLATIKSALPPYLPINAGANRQAPCLPTYRQAAEAKNTL